MGQEKSDIEWRFWRWRRGQGEVEVSQCLREGVESDRVCWCKKLSGAM